MRSQALFFNSGGRFNRRGLCFPFFSVVLWFPLLAVCGVVVGLVVCGSLWLCWLLFGGGRWVFRWSVVLCFVVCFCVVFPFVFLLSSFSFFFSRFWCVLPFFLLVLCLFFSLPFLAFFSFFSFEPSLLSSPLLFKNFPFAPFYLLVDLICVVTELQ